MKRHYKGKGESNVDKVKVNGIPTYLRNDQCTKTLNITWISYLLSVLYLKLDNKILIK